MNNELIRDIRMLIVGNHSMAIGANEASKQIAEKCREVACEAVKDEEVLLGSISLICKADVIEAIRKAFGTDE